MLFKYDKILIASNNASKIKEIVDVIIEHKIADKILTPKDISSNAPEPDEIALDLLENARIKAIEFYNWAKVPVISDDSGLEVEALDGKPGVHSARYAGLNSSDDENKQKLLGELADNANRKAQFRCVLCLFDGKQFIFGEGRCEGEIGYSEVGSNGFGYDPVFIPKGYNKTFGELSKEIKYQISHRTLALKDLALKLKQQDYYS